VAPPHLREVPGPAADGRAEKGGRRVRRAEDPRELHAPIPQRQRLGRARARGARGRARHPQNLRAAQEEPRLQALPPRHAPHQHSGECARAPPTQRYVKLNPYYSAPSKNKIFQESRYYSRI